MEVSPVILRGEPPKALAAYDGSGDGSGDGYGSGDGSGYGYGSGSGYGDGYGSGYGSEKYWLAAIGGFASKWEPGQRSRLDVLRDAGATIAYWRSDAQGRPANGGNGDPVKPGDVQTIKGPLKVCTRQALHATLNPPKWQGERWWIVALTGEVVEDDDKFGALSREIIGECL